MAKPQIEDGHIDIANEIAEAMYQLQLSGNQWRLLWVILRQTYGWHKKIDEISISFFQKKTHLKRRHISRALKDMNDRKIITKNDNSFTRSYGLQKNYELWQLSPNIASPKKTSPKMTATITKNDTKTITKNGAHKRNSKETIQKKLYLDSEFVKLTPKEFKKLKSKYGEEVRRLSIEKLDNYIGSTGKKYKSHYRTILNWVADEIIKGKKKSKLEDW